MSSQLEDAFNEAVERRVAELRAALEFYANADNYVGGEVGWWADAPDGEQRWCMDFGSIARAALAAADREAPDGPRCNCVQYIEGDVTYHASGCPRAPVSDEPKLRRDTGGEAADFLGGYPPVPDETEES